MISPARVIWSTARDTGGEVLSLGRATGITKRLLGTSLWALSPSSEQASFPSYHHLPLSSVQSSAIRTWQHHLPPNSSHVASPNVGTPHGASIITGHSFSLSSFLGLMPLTVLSLWKLPWTTQSQPLLSFTGCVFPRLGAQG